MHASLGGWWLNSVILNIIRKCVHVVFALDMCVLHMYMCTLADVC